MSVKNSENVSLNRETPSFHDGRRHFITKGLNWITVFVSAAVMYPLLRFLQFETPKKPVIAKVHKKLVPGGFWVDRDFILFEGEKGPWAVSRKCTHLGCRLNYFEKEGQLICPCHESRFTIDGTRISGPARKDLPKYVVEREMENDNRIYTVTL